jgi:DNA-binding winged helix-turn-helix (wHTH) protein
MLYTFGRVQLDDACFELKRDGRVVEVEPRVFDFILYLINHRARVVLKDELLSQVWKQSCISESALTRCACEARKALGDPSLIKTVRGRGYRWSAGGASSLLRNNELQDAAHDPAHINP